MSTRRVTIVILCEDSQHEVFARSFLEGMGWKGPFRIEKSPSGRGSGAQFVLERFPLELKTYRSRRNKAQSALVVIVDGDKKDRFRELTRKCDERSMPFRKDDEVVSIAIPKRNIETWIHFLNGETIDEEKSYSKFQKESDCNPMVKALVKQCKSGGLSAEAPTSLRAACEEYQRIAAAL